MVIILIIIIIVIVKIIIIIITITTGWRCGNKAPSLGTSRGGGFRQHQKRAGESIVRVREPD